MVHVYQGENLKKGPGERNMYLSKIGVQNKSSRSFWSRINSKGQAAGELALILPVLIFIVFATFELARIYNIQQHLTSAAQMGARTGTIRNSTVASTESAIRTYLVETEVGTNYATVITGVGPNEDFNSTVNVQVKHTVKLFSKVAFPGFDGFQIPLKASITMRHQ